MVWANEGHDDGPGDMCGFDRYKLFNKSTMREKWIELVTCPKIRFSLLPRQWVQKYMSSITASILRNLLRMGSATRISGYAGTKQKVTAFLGVPKRGTPSQWFGWCTNLSLGHSWNVKAESCRWSPADFPGKDVLFIVRFFSCWFTFSGRALRTRNELFVKKSVY